jgi:tRNA (adenine57-N1/adenine58-N1)-methyltransferase
MKNGELILLISEKNSYLTEVKREKFHTKDGIFDLNELRKKRFGDEIRTHMNKKFTVVKPSIVDILERRAERLPQIIMPKDAALIISHTGIGPGSLVVDAGSGSAFLAIFLANYVKPGRVVTYEKNRGIAKVARANIRSSGLKNIKLNCKDIRKGIVERNVDLVTLDMKDAEKVVRHAYRALKPGGWLAVYSPYIEQVKAVVKEIKKKSFCELKTVENIVRVWEVRKHTLPERSGILHTGWITFARKVK